MSTLTVTAKGQVTLRKELLEHLGVHPDGHCAPVFASRSGRDRNEGLSARAGRISDVFGLV